MSVSAWRCPRVWHARLSSRFPASNCHTGSDDRARLQAFARHLDLNSQAVRPPLTFDTSAELSACHASKLAAERSEEHTSELPSLMRISYAVFCLKKKITT